MRMSGARSLRLNEDGGLVVKTSLGEVRFTPPSAYQQVGGARQPVQVAYVLKGREYGFRVGGHDPALPVVIDPLVQSTYLGGSGVDEPFALAIHPTSGDVYLTGTTTSTNFPGTAGGAQPANAGGCGASTDAFVARLTADLRTLTQATYLGGSCDDHATALAIHPASGDVYVAGFTNSTDFPGTTGGAQPANGAVPDSFTADAFIARLTADLTTLTRATYLGGTLDEQGWALSIPSTSGNVYIAGWTRSTNFPGTAGGAQPANGGGSADAFTAHLTADLTTLTKSTYLGGSGEDIAFALTIHPVSGDVYVAGYTNSTDFPGTLGGAQATLGGGNNPDAFVARLTADLTTLTKSTYLGGFGQDIAYALAIHPTSGDVYVAGFTSSPDLPGTTGGAQPANAGDTDAFIARLTVDLTGLTKATYLGGSGGDGARALAIHTTSGDVYVAGPTSSTDFPRTIGGAQAIYGGGGDAFAARFTADLTILTKDTYLGGSDGENANALAIHPTSGDVYVAGVTNSTNFPGTTGGAQPTYAGNFSSYDAFVARLTPDLTAPPASLFTVAPCRVADTRGPAGPSGGPTLTANTVRNFPVTGICGIPASATAVAINIAIWFPSDSGDLRIYPTGRAAPLASTINFRTFIVRANNAVVPLGAGGQITVQCDMPSGTTTHFFFDVYGYFQ